MRQRWIVFSPDGVPIRYNSFPSRAAALGGLYKWCARYAWQGYYASASEQIPLDKLPSRCRIEVVWVAGRHGGDA